MSDNANIIAAMETELARLLDWGRAAESRLALVLSLSTAMLGTLAVLAPPFDSWQVLSAIFSFLAALLLILSILFSGFATFPRTSGPKGSLIYFGGIVTLDVEQYAAALKKQTQEQYVDDLIKQCHRNAQIAERKLYWIQRAMACLFLASIPWTASLLLLYSGSPKCR